MRKVLLSVAVLALACFIGCGGDGGEGDPNANGEAHTNTNSDVNIDTNSTAVSVLSSFSTTYVPHTSLGGVSLGTTYEAVTAAHGEPTSIAGPSSHEGDVTFQVYYTDGQVGSHIDEIVIFFLDINGDNQLSPRDVARAIRGQGLRFQHNGTGVGSTATQVIAAFGQPLEHPYESTGGRVLMYTGPGLTYTVFNINDSLSTVESISVGDAR
jgi:hypothetical protein